MKNKMKKPKKKDCPPTPPPIVVQAPSELSVLDAGADRVIVQFKDNSDNEERFQLQRFFGEVADDAQLDQTHDVPASPGVGSMVSFTDNTPAPNTQYTYRVRGHIDGDFVSEWSNLVTVTTPAE